MLIIWLVSRIKNDSGTVRNRSDSYILVLSIPSVLLLADTKQKVQIEQLGTIDSRMLIWLLMSVFSTG